MTSTKAPIKSQPGRLFRLFCGVTWFVLIWAANSAFANTEGKSAQVDYISPDGQFSALTPARSVSNQPGATFIDRDTISCVLKEGETTFIIELPRNAPHDRFIFLNENAAACGELRIAVSDSALPADSPKWNEVDGIVPFAHKRLFKLSILGVETKFVRLSFKVDTQQHDSAKLTDPFRSSVLAADINSKLRKLGEQHHDFSVAAVSVAPLAQSKNH